jgi:hypothetical protein
MTPPRSTSSIGLPEALSGPVAAVLIINHGY